MKKKKKRMRKKEIRWRWKEAEEGRRTLSIAWFPRFLPAVYNPGRPRWYMLWYNVLVPPPTMVATTFLLG
ncbi:hypothetical protein M0802_000276 [Mischocyttarus mexicanus]|nr:hypothetical protein M0802_000276 [Mischocyttarus mexicanus]